MNLIIKGGTQSQRKTVSTLVRNIVAQPEFPTTNVIVAVKFHGIIKKDGCRGLCAFGRRVVLIELDSSLQGAELVDIVAHEMIHAHQFLSGDLGYTSDLSEFVWKGINLAGVAYADQPHEILAHGLSQVLLQTLEERAGV